MERLGCRYCHKGEITTAIKTFNSLVKIPDHVNGWDLLSCVYRRTRNMILQKKSFRKAIDMIQRAYSWVSLGYPIRRDDLNKQKKYVERL